MKILITLVILCFSSVAIADTVTLKEKIACTPDAFKYCIHLKPQKNEPNIGMQLVSCLQEHRFNLRKACQDIFTKRGM